jgi:hypothetical protein
VDWEPARVQLTSTDDTTNTNLLKLVRYAARSAGVATSKLDAAIREARRAGASLREIVAESGISHMSVKRIVERSHRMTASRARSFGHGNTLSENTVSSSSCPRRRVSSAVVVFAIASP